jgi:hypothetical protein
MRFGRQQQGGQQQQDQRNSQQHSGTKAAVSRSHQAFAAML